MMGLRHIKANPSTYVIQYRNGVIVREGAGLSFWHFTLSSSLVSVPLESVDVPFVFSEVSSDFQEVMVQGQVTYRVGSPATLTGLMNFTLAAPGRYATDDPEKLPQRVVNAVQVKVRSVVQATRLEALLRSSDQLEQTVRGALGEADSLPSLGLELVNLVILAIKPSPETARALEAEVREAILKRADDATYVRRNAAIEQERSVKENELNTEIAIEAKKRQIREAQLEAERSVLTKRQAINEQELSGRIALEEKGKALSALRAQNARTEADAKAYAIAVTMKAVENMDPKILQAMLIGHAEPATLIAQAFQGIAENAARIGELNISPDLLQSLAKGGAPKARA